MKIRRELQMKKNIFSSNIDQKSNKRLMINMLANIISYTSVLLISFVLTPYLINSLGKEVYSFYPIANSFVSYMSVVLNALNAIANRFITIEIIKKNYDKINRYFSSIFFSNLFISIFLLIPIVLIIIFIDTILDVPINLIASIRTLFLFTFSSMIVSIGTSVFGVATYATNRIDLRSYRELIVGLIRIVMYIFLFSFFKPTIVYIGVVALVVAISNFIIQVFYTKKLMPKLLIRKRFFSIKFVKDIIPSSIWNVINQIGNIMLSGTSLVLANILYGTSAGADYSIIQTVPAFLNGVITMLVGVFMPMIMQYYAEGDVREAVHKTIIAQKLVGIFSCSVISVFIALGADFFSLWVPHENETYLQFLSISAIFPHIIISSVWPVSNLNVVINKLRTPALYLIINGAINIIAVYIASFIFPGKLIVLILINSIIQIVWVGIFVPIYPCRYLNVPKSTFYPPLLKTLVGTLLGVAISLEVKRLFIIDSWFSLFCIAIGCGMIVLAIQATIVIGPKEIKTFFKGKLVSK